MRGFTFDPQAGQWHRNWPLISTLPRTRQTLRMLRKATLDMVSGAEFYPHPFQPNGEPLPEVFLEASNLIRYGSISAVTELLPLIDPPHGFEPLVNMFNEAERFWRPGVLMVNVTLMSILARSHTVRLASGGTATVCSDLHIQAIHVADQDDIDALDWLNCQITMDLLEAEIWPFLRDPRIAGIQPYQRRRKAQLAQ